MGRRRVIPDIMSRNFKEKTHSQRQAVNFSIQGVSEQTLSSVFYYDIIPCILSMKLKYYFILLLLFILFGFFPGLRRVMI